MNMIFIAGVDEAGKGPVLGPMMVAGVVMQEDRLNELNKLGVKDSKVVSATRRNYLSAKIKELADSYYILEVSARQIDEFRKIITMNQIMVLSHANVLDQLKPNIAYLDAADVKEDRFGENVKMKCCFSIDVVAKHKADTKYPIVSAASILAKSHRDRAMRDLEKNIGVPLGSGYPSDPVTKRFLADWIKENKTFPEIVRHSWKTTENLLNL
jgi:ribonuclease HII